MNVRWCLLIDIQLFYYLKNWLTAVYYPTISNEKFLQWFWKRQNTFNVKKSNVYIENLMNQKNSVKLKWKQNETKKCAFKILESVHK